MTDLLTQEELDLLLHGSVTDENLIKDIVSQGNHNVYAKMVSTFIFDSEKRLGILEKIEAATEEMEFRIKPKAAPKPSYIPAHSIKDFIDIIISREEPLLLESLFKQLHDVLRIVVGFAPENISYFLKKLRSISPDISVMQGLDTLVWLRSSLKMYADVFVRIDKSFYYLNKCGTNAGRIVKDCFTPLCQSHRVKPQDDEILTKLGQLGDYRDCSAFYSTVFEIIENSDANPVTCIDWLIHFGSQFKQHAGPLIVSIIGEVAQTKQMSNDEMLNFLDWVGKIFRQIEAHFSGDLVAIEFLERCVKACLSSMGKDITVLEMTVIIADFVSSCREHDVRLHEKVFEKFLAIEKAHRPEFFAELTSTYHNLLYGHCDVKQDNIFVAHLLVMHTGISYADFIAILAELKNIDRPAISRLVPCHSVALPLHKKSNKWSGNRHPEALRKLALIFEKALFNPVDFSESQNKIAQQLASLEEKIPQLPQEVQKTQVCLLAKLKTAADFLSKPESSSPPYAILVFALTLIGTSNSKLSYLSGLAVEFFFRDVIANPSANTIAQQLQDIESDLAVFSHRHIFALYESFSDFLSDEIDFALDKLWSDTKHIPVLIEELAAEHRCWRSISKNTIQNLISIRQKLKDMVVSEFRNFCNYHALRDELDAMTDKSGGTYNIDFVPSTSAMDGFFGYIGGTCCAPYYRAILRPDFLCVRMINRDNMRWDGVIHVLLTHYNTEPALLLAGIEPRSEIATTIDNRALWEAVKQWAIEYATAQNYKWVLQTTNLTATSNRTMLAEVIEEEISSKEVVKLDDTMTFPNTSDEKYRRYHDYAYDIYHLLGLGDDDIDVGDYDMSYCVVLSRIPL